MQEDQTPVRVILAPPYSGKTALCRSLFVLGEPIVDGDAVVSARLGSWPHGDPDLLARTLAEARPALTSGVNRPPLIVWCPPEALIRHIPARQLAVYVPDELTAFGQRRTTNTRQLVPAQILKTRAEALLSALDHRIRVYSTASALADGLGLTYRPVFRGWEYQGALSVPDGPRPLRHVFRHQPTLRLGVIKLLGHGASPFTFKIWDVPEAPTFDVVSWLAERAGWSTNVPLPVEEAERTRPLATALLQDTLLGSL